MIRFISVFSGTALLLMVPFNAEAACTFLQPVGGGEKKVEPPKGLVGNAVGRTNWNTDFVVDRSYKSFKLFFTADSTDSTSYPIQAFLKCSDGSNLKVYLISCSLHWAPDACSCPVSRSQAKASAR